MAVTAAAVEKGAAILHIAPGRFDLAHLGIPSRSR
jgi:hypothetical protein